MEQKLKTDKIFLGERIQITKLEKWREAKEVFILPSSGWTHIIVTQNINIHSTLLLFKLSNILQMFNLYLLMELQPELYHHAQLKGIHRFKLNTCSVGITLPYILIDTHLHINKTH